MDYYHLDACPHFSYPHFSFVLLCLYLFAGDFHFQNREVAFGICPTNEIQYFENLVQNKFPFVDLSSSASLSAAKNRLGALARFKGLNL